MYCLLSETYGYRGSCCLPPVCCNTDVLIQARASITSRVSDLNVIIEPRWFYSRIYHNRLLPVYCSPIFPFQVCLIFYFSDRESYDPPGPPLTTPMALDWPHYISKSIIYWLTGSYDVTKVTSRSGDKSSAIFCNEPPQLATDRWSTLSWNESKQLCERAQQRSPGCKATGHRSSGVLF